jgi:hypothetical protein
VAGNPTPLQRWRAARADREQEHLIEDTFSEDFGRPSERHIRAWKNRELHAQLASNELHPVERSMAERELDKRKAHEGSAPTRRLAWIAICISALSLLLGLWNALSRPS